MGYTITEVSKKTGLSTHTLRYYEKEGLLPFVDRDINGNRVFKEDDLTWLKTITCLKNTGMPIKKFKEYIDLDGDSENVFNKRLEIVKTHKVVIEEKINELKDYMKYIDYKINYFEDAIESIK